MRDAKQVNAPAATQTQTEYVYDATDRLVRRVDPRGKYDEYTYNSQGQVTRVTDRRGVVTVFRYDALGRTSLVGFGTTGPLGSEVFESFQHYVYDAQGRVHRVEDSTSGDVQFDYNDLDQVLTETTPQGTLHYTYDVHGRRDTMRLDTGSGVHYDYDTRDRLHAVTRGTQ